MEDARHKQDCIENMLRLELVGAKIRIKLLGNFILSLMVAYELGNGSTGTVDGAVGGRERDKERTNTFRFHQFVIEILNNRL